MQIPEKVVSGREWLTEMCGRLHVAMRAVDSCLRLEILIELAAGESDVSTLASTLHLEISVVSKYLTKLRKLGIAQCRRDKKRHIYALAPEVQLSIRDGQFLVKVAAAQSVTCELGVPIEMLNQLRVERGLPALCLDGSEEVPFPKTSLPNVDHLRSGQVRVCLTEPIIRLPNGFHAPEPRAR